MNVGNQLRNVTQSIWQACSHLEAPKTGYIPFCVAICMTAIACLYDRSHNRVWRKERPVRKVPVPQLLPKEWREEPEEWIDNDIVAKGAAASSLSYRRQLPDDCKAGYDGNAESDDEQPRQRDLPSIAGDVHHGVIDSGVIGKPAAEQKQAFSDKERLSSEKQPILTSSNQKILQYNRRLFNRDQVEKRLQAAFSRAQENNDMVPKEAKGKWGKISYEVFPARLDRCRPGFGADRQIPLQALEITKRNVFLPSGKGGVAHMQGLRPSMEDRECIHHFSLGKGEGLQTVSLLALFDGHNGSKCAEFLARRVPLHAEKALGKAVASYGGPDERTAIYNALTTLFVPMTKKYIKNNNDCRKSSRSAAIAVFKIRERLWVANAGDSRAIVIDNQDTVALSKEPRPEDCEKSIRNRNGWMAYREGMFPVTSGPWWETWIKNDGLPMARAVGYPELGGTGMNPRAEVMEYVLKASEGPRFLVVCCDGVWDILSTNQVGELVRAHQDKSPSEIAEIIIKQAYCQGSTDNLTAMVMPLAEVPQEHDGGGARASTDMV